MTLQGQYVQSIEIQLGKNIFVSYTPTASISATMYLHTAVQTTNEILSLKVLKYDWVLHVSSTLPLEML